MAPSLAMVVAVLALTWSAHAEPMASTGKQAPHADVCRSCCRSLSSNCSWQHLRHQTTPAVHARPVVTWCHPALVTHLAALA
jgi:hypothetical protein